jgi:aryl-alcohol dehydrogenase-like predicted oxidoreductase
VIGGNQIYTRPSVDTNKNRFNRIDTQRMDFHNQVILGRSGLKVGRLGISSSYGAPAEAFEMAFEAGCNYFTYGTFIKGGSMEMRKAVRNIVNKRQRDRLVVSIFSYSHTYFLIEPLLKRDLKKLGTDYADFLILGYYNTRPGNRMMDVIYGLKDKGLIRNLAISSHKRAVFARLEKEKLLDGMHLRYNAVHRGAEQDVFPFFDRIDRPGIVSFTATRWGQLLNAKRMPPGNHPPKATDAYRFALSNPYIDVCMTGARNTKEMQENIHVLEKGPMEEEELTKIRKIGDYLYGR